MLMSLMPRRFWGICGPAIREWPNIASSLLALLDARQR
jgi:hypothetical protein